MKYFTLFATILMCSNLQAQSPIGFNATAGVNSSSLVSEDLLANPAMGYKAGIVFNFGYHETYNYQIETFYNKSTLDLLTVDSNYDDAGVSKFDYSTVDLGFYFNYYIIKLEEDAFYIGPQAGMTFSFGGQLEAQEATASDDEFYLPHLLNENSLSTLPKMSYGAGLGLTGGYNDFRFDLRYTLGLNNILTDVQTNSYDEFNRYTGPVLEGKLNTISFTISYRFFKLLGT